MSPVSFAFGDQEQSHIASVCLSSDQGRFANGIFLRNPNNPNLRSQDGDKHELLCTACEGRFGESEGKFNDHIFADFHEYDRDQFTYGPWLHYFMTSIAWRTLVLDIPGFESDAECPRAIVKQLSEVEVTMRNYLVESNQLARCLHNHAVAWTQGHVASPKLAAAGPNVSIRRSVFGYTVLDRKNEQAAVLHNLAGFMCFLIIKGNPRDTWSGTKIYPEGGKIQQPQKVNSSLMGELLGCVVESSRKRAKISDKQQEIIAKSMARNPDAPALRFQVLDEQIQIDSTKRSQHGTSRRNV